MNTPSPLSIQIVNGKNHYLFDVLELKQFLSETKETSLGVVDDKGVLISALSVATLRKLVESM
jgi:hypothetical protein